MGCGQMMACLSCLETWNDGTTGVIFPGDFRRPQTFEGVAAARHLILASGDER
jgi:hypothetical protein